MVKNWLPVCRKKCFSLDFIHFQDNGYKERLQSVSLSGQDFSDFGNMYMASVKYVQRKKLKVLIHYQIDIDTA